MYRRLKNLLGVSLIIFAILLSQMPMPQVQADNDTTEAEATENQENVTVTLQYGLTNLNPSVDKITVAAGGKLDVGTIQITVDGDTRKDLQEGEIYSIDGVEYKFSGWYDTSTTGPKWDFASNIVTEDTTLYATWERVDGTEYSYSEVMEDVKQAENDENEETIVDENSAQETLISSTGSNQKDVIITFYFGLPKEYFDNVPDNSVPNGMEEKDGVAYIESKQTITDQNMGAVIDTIPISDYLENSVHKLLIKGNSKDCTLLGWYTEENYLWDFTKVISDDMKLYARWDLGNEQYTITYQATGATSNAVQTVTVKAGETLPKPPQTPVRSGYHISDWYIDANGTILADWNQKVASDMTLYAKWENNDYTVTFDMNGGYYQESVGNEKETYQAFAKTGEKVSDILPEETKIQYNYSEAVKESAWYYDQECLSQCDISNTVIDKNLTLYKKWHKVTAAGFDISMDGKTLYEYKGNIDSQTKVEVKIPDTVKTIADNAFSDMSNIRSITLPSSLSYLSVNAFSGMKNVTSDVYLLASGKNGDASYTFAQTLVQTYEHFVYTSVLKPEVATPHVDSSLFSSNTASGEKNLNSYVTMTLPEGLEADTYNLALSTNGESNTLKKYFSKYDAKTLYYMDLKLTRTSMPEADISAQYSKDKKYQITIPLPKDWQTMDLKKYTVAAYTIENDATEPELLQSSIVTDADVKCIRFDTWHFSDYLLVYKKVSSNSGGGSSSGGGTSGESGSSASDNGSSGDSSSADGNSSGTSASSSGTSSTGGAPTGNSNSAGSGISTPDITQISTQPVDSSGTSRPTGTSSGTGHVKDSTPKTGDPLEYRTLLVCGFFSMGVLLLLIGNKKKTSASLRYPRV